ncbi:Na+:solute symporter [Wenzhouxiangella sp. AB-CW3]|nr:Na+:solute symporter [Wenzhouxiangella sp. AB-CW3]
MALKPLDYAIIVSFILLIVSIGLLFSKRGGKSTSNFFLGGRSLPWYLAGTSMVATTFAADTPLAVTELVREGGIAGNWLWWNMLAGGMLTTFFFARYWRRAGILTDVELVQLRYSGKEARFLRGFKAVYMGVFLNAAIIGWVNLALITLLQVFFGLSATEALWWTLAAMVVVYIYSGLSGLLGVVYTDFVQFIAAMSGSIILAVLVVNSSDIGGIEGLKASLPDSAFSFFPRVGEEAESTGNAVSTVSVLSLGLGSFLALVCLPWWNSWYPGAEPGGGGYVAQRMMSAKDEKNAVYANLLFQILHYTVRPWPWILVALSAIVLYPELSGEEARMGYVLAMKEYLPTGLKGMLLAAFFAAYMSTVASQLNWGTSYLINDFFRAFIKPDASEQQLVLASRIAVFCMIIVAFIVTSQLTTIAAVWNFLIQAGAGLGLVLILRWYWWRVSAWSEISATVAPFIGYGFVQFVLARHVDPVWGEPIISDPRGFLFTISFTMVTWLTVTFLTKPTDRKTLEAFYKRVQPAGAWGPFRESSSVRKLWKLAAAWISAVIMAYTILFTSGSVLFRHWGEALVYGAVCILAFLCMRHFSSQVKVFE